MAFRFSQKLRAFLRQQRGHAAVEFAFIAPVFFGLLLGIMEVGLTFYSQNVLQESTMAAARLVRTGTAQGTDYATASKCTGGEGGSGAGGTYASAQEWFKDQVCCGISGIMSDCTNLHVNVQNYTGGFGTDFTNTLVGGLLVPVTDNYSPGLSCDVVLIRATYTQTVITPGLSWFLVNMAGGKHLLSATSAFRNEPYNAGAVC